MTKYTSSQELKSMDIEDPKVQQQKQNSRNKLNEPIYKSSSSIYIRCIIICMGAINMGYNAGVLNLAQPKLNIEYGLEDNLAMYQGILGSCLLLGCAIGCLLLGAFIEKFAARNTSIICDISIIVLVSFYSIPNYYLAVCIRFILGIVLGINISLVPLYVKSVTPTDLVGKTGSFQSMFISLGILIAVCIGQGFPIEDEDVEKQNGFFWRFVLLFPIIPAAIRLFSMLFVYKLNPPIAYIRQNNQKGAIQSLREIYFEEHIQNQLQILNDLVQKQNEEQQNDLRQIFDKKIRNRVELGFMLQVIFQFTGIVSIMLYSKIIFEKAIGDKQIAQYMAIGAGFFQVVPSFISGQLSNCFGRKQLLIWGKVILSVILFGLGTITLINKDGLENNNVSMFSGVLTISLVFMYCIVFRLTTGTVTWTYTSEILSYKANDIAIFIHFFSAFIVGVLFPISVEAFGIHSLFYFFGFCIILGVIYLWPRLVETKGLIMKEIEELFRKKIAQKEQKYQVKNSNETEKELQNTQQDKQVNVKIIKKENKQVQSQVNLQKQFTQLPSGPFE